MNDRTKELVDLMRNEVASAETKWNDCKLRATLVATAIPFIGGGYAAAIESARIFNNPTIGNIATGIAAAGVAYIATECTLAIKAYRDLKSAGTIKAAGDLTDEQRDEVTKILAGENAAALRTSAQLTPSQSQFLGNSGATKRLAPLDRVAIYLTQDNPPISSTEAKQALIEAGLVSGRVKAELEKSDGLDKGNKRLIEAISDLYEDKNRDVVNGWVSVQKGNPAGFKAEVQSIAEKTVEFAQSLMSQKPVGQSLIATLQAPARADSTLKTNKAVL